MAVRSAPAVHCNTTPPARELNSSTNLHASATASVTSTSLEQHRQQHQNFGTTWDGPRFRHCHAHHFTNTGGSLADLYMKDKRTKKNTGAIKAVRSIK